MSLVNVHCERTYITVFENRLIKTIENFPHSHIAKVRNRKAEYLTITYLNRLSSDKRNETGRGKADRRKYPMRL